MGKNYQKGRKACHQMINILFFPVQSKIIPGEGILSNIHTWGKEEELEQVDPLPLWVDFVNNIQQKALDTSVFVRKSALTGTNSIILDINDWMITEVYLHVSKGMLMNFPITFFKFQMREIS